VGIVRVTWAISTLWTLKNFATASRRHTGDIHNSTIVGLFMTHCLQLSLQLHTIGLVRTCRISSFCTVAWQLERLLLTRRIARSLGNSWASCMYSYQQRRVIAITAHNFCPHMNLFWPTERWHSHPRMTSTTVSKQAHNNAYSLSNNSITRHM